jgi:hypothetical protein
VRLLLIALLGLVPACIAKRGTETSQPVGAEAVGVEPVVFVEVATDPTRVEPKPAEPPLPTPSPEQQQQAKLLFEAGVQLYQAGDIAAALGKFREAYALVPLPALLFNIARGQEQLGDVVGACATYRTVLADPQADDAMHVSVTERLTQLSCP